MTLETRSIPLSQLSRGDRAIVDTDALEADESAMLRAMGLVCGSEVTVCRSGRNCIVRVESTRLGLSLRVAKRILALPCACADQEASESTD